MEDFKDWIENRENVKKAYDFAQKAHAGQFRKIKKDGVRLNYFTHPEQVARLVYELKNSKEIESLVIAALLHDVPEDTEYSLEQIREIFGELVFNIVKELTNDPVERGDLTKEKYLIKKMLKMTNWGLVIKLCDRLHNISNLSDSETSDDIKFAKYYIDQTKNIIIDLKENRELTKTQKKIVEMAEDQLKLIVF